MNAEDLAKVLNGREYTEEMTDEEEVQAKANGLVVVFGASDDLLEFRGAISDELGAYGGTRLSLGPEGLLINDCDDPECPYFKKKIDACSVEVVAKWGEDGYSWVISLSKPNIPVATFDIMEGSEKFCKGIVFRLSDLAQNPASKIG